MLVNRQLVTPLYRRNFTMTETTDITAAERTVLRDLARRVAETAALPEMAERRNLWRTHNSMQESRPTIYINPQGSWGELVPPSDLRCVGQRARGIESDLRRRLYAFRHFASDNVVEAEWVVCKAIRSSGWGLEPRRRPSTQPRGAFGFDPVIHKPSDLRKLRFPDVQYDEATTLRALDLARDLFGDILDVRLKGIATPWYHLMNQYTALRGLDQVMLDMVENPGMLHEAMAFLEQGHHRLLRQYVEQGLLSLNNDNTPIYTSGHGYTDELPKPGASPGRMRPCDLWCWAEAQEMAQVSPAMHKEFAFDYEKRLLAPFGLVGYGCCEDLSRKLDFVLTVPNLRRVSICPWADVESCARQLRDIVIFMWKPQPAHLVGTFNPDLVRRYVQRTMRAARENGCTLEIALLDTHTCENHPERFDQWARIVREEAEGWEA
jgi:hypothetical protein